MRPTPMMGTAYKILDQPFDHVSTQREGMLMMPHKAALIMCKGMERPDNRARTDRSLPFIFCLIPPPPLLRLHTKRDVMATERHPDINAVSLTQTCGQQYEYWMRGAKV